MNKSALEVSVVMSVYNGERFLRWAVESILNQTFKNYEFIIINDGSTDGTKEILESYNDVRIALINQQCNTGLTKALNRGLALARGNYIARMDADDVSRADRLEKQLTFMKDKPEIVLLGSNFYKINEEEKVVEQARVPVEEAQIKWDLFFYNCFGHSNVMFRKKEVNDLGGYNDTVYYAQDYDLWMRIAERYPVANHEEPLFYYRMPTKGTITHEKAHDQEKQAEEIYLAALNTLVPGILHRRTEIENLRDFILAREEIKDIDATEKLFLEIYNSFCNSTFVTHLEEDMLKTVKIEPYTKFAWAYFKQGYFEDYDRCIKEVIDNGFQGPFDIPSSELYRSEHYLVNTLHNYFFSNGRNAGNEKRGKDFLNSQYLHYAWRYYNEGDMRGFRRCILKLFINTPSGKWLLLWLKSLLGKRGMDELHRLRSVTTGRV